MPNMQLAVFSVLCASAKEQFETLFSNEIRLQLQLVTVNRNFRLCPVSQNGCGFWSFSVQVYRFMDNVVKGLTSGVSIVFGILASSFIFNIRSTLIFWLVPLWLLQLDTSLAIKFPSSTLIKYPLLSALLFYSYFANLA
mmetsp:Transcript_9097/g.10065  ORF Transcript_9097/g.10065 Transcript_9097/m.10065 type:complete len:139 (+) Transcript_9097:593-1009(+)